MFDFNALSELSRSNCAGICAFLVPANILSTLLTIILTALNRSIYQIWQAVGFATIFACVMMLHVYTWFVIGVVMLPTYILLALAFVCLLTNLSAIIWRINLLDLIYAGKYSHKNSEIRS